MRSLLWIGLGVAGTHAAYWLIARWNIAQAQRAYHRQFAAAFRQEGRGTYTDRPAIGIRWLAGEG